MARISSRLLIVNADDFGHSPPVNAGILEAHERGIVTSASLMVRRPAAVEAVARAGGLALGLHVELGAGRRRAESAVAGEVRSQLEAFRELTGRDPTHLDSHQHVHRREPARAALLALAEELAVPLRELDRRVRYCGEFYGQNDRGEPFPELVTAERLIGLIAELPPGVTELGCHPARGRVPGSSYDAERERELEALCDPRVRAALEDAGIELTSFASLRTSLGS